MTLLYDPTLWPYSMTLLYDPTTSLTQKLDKASIKFNRDTQMKFAV